MGEDREAAVAFSRPGGEACGKARRRPIDLAHLARQTLDDRAVEAEVLGMFMRQASTVREEVGKADADGRRRLAHGLKGAALGIGAFAVAEAAAAVEKEPDSGPLLKTLSAAIDEARQFIASITR